jgi:hypothetical protein
MPLFTLQFDVRHGHPEPPQVPDVEHRVPRLSISLSLQKLQSPIFGNVTARERDRKRDRRKREREREREKELEHQPTLSPQP